MIVPLLKLIKYKLSLAVTLSSAAGFILHGESSGTHLLSVIAGVFCLAGGSAALNEVQERKTDAMMPRTRCRPIPSGKVSVPAALILSVILVLAGLVLLSFSGFLPVLLGLVNLILYNGLYTNLKLRTSFAVLPGGLVGAVPPLIGWSAAGGSLFHPNILFVATLLFLWQMPHFWLLLIRYGQEYEAAGFSTIRRYLDDNQIKRLVFVWMAVSSAFLLTAPLFGIDWDIRLLIPVVLLNIAFVSLFHRLLFRTSSEGELRLIFILTNLFLTVILLILILSSIT